MHYTSWSSSAVRPVGSLCFLRQSGNRHVSMKCEVNFKRTLNPTKEKEEFFSISIKWRGANKQGCTAVE